MEALQGLFDFGVQGETLSQVTSPTDVWIGTVYILPELKAAEPVKPAFDSSTKKHCYPWLLSFAFVATATTTGTASTPYPTTSSTPAALCVAGNVRSCVRGWNQP